MLRDAQAPCGAYISIHYQYIISLVFNKKDNKCIHPRTTYILLQNSYHLFLPFLIIFYSWNEKFCRLSLPSFNENIKQGALGKKINHLRKKKKKREEAKNPLRHHSNPEYWQTYGKKTPTKRDDEVKIVGRLKAVLKYRIGTTGKGGWFQIHVYRQIPD